MENLKEKQRVVMELTFDEDASSSSKRLRNLEILASGL